MDGFSLIPVKQFENVVCLCFYSRIYISSMISRDIGKLNAAYPLPKELDHLLLGSMDPGT